MGIIKCPNCNNEISDKAEKCIHCNYEFIRNMDNRCLECGNEITENDTICGVCGCPVTGSKKIQKVELKVKLGNGISKKKMLALLLIVLITAVGFLTFKYVKNNIEKEKLRKEREQYIYDYKIVTYQMLDGAAKSEKCGNKIKKVWSNSIWKESDEETDKYTKKNGLFNDDFNDSLRNLFNDVDFIKLTDEIEENRKKVTKIMKTLKNPPEDWQDAYNDLKEYYNEYLNLTNLCVNPSGSLQTYSSNFSNADTNTVNWYEKVKIHLD